MTQFIDERTIKRNRFWPPRDRDDVQIPHKLESISFLRAVPWVLRFFDKVVPEEFWTEEIEVGAEDPRILISCPCGEEPALQFRLRSFDMAECECGRFFMHDGKQVRSGRADASES